MTIDRYVFFYLHKIFISSFFLIINTSIFYDVKAIKYIFFRFYVLEKKFEQKVMMFCFEKVY